VKRWEEGARAGSVMQLTCLVVDRSTSRFVVGHVGEEDSSRREMVQGLAASEVQKHGFYRRGRYVHEARFIRSTSAR